MEYAWKPMEHLVVESVNTEDGPLLVRSMSSWDLFRTRQLAKA